jgi:hypothetical protein
VEGGRWKVEGGRWKVEGGRWKVEREGGKGGRSKVEGGGKGEVRNTGIGKVKFQGKFQGKVKFKSKGRGKFKGKVKVKVKSRSRLTFEHEVQHLFLKLVCLVHQTWRMVTCVPQAFISEGPVPDLHWRRLVGVSPPTSVRWCTRVEPSRDLCVTS